MPVGTWLLAVLLAPLAGPAGAVRIEMHEDLDDPVDGQADQPSETDAEAAERPTFRGGPRQPACEVLSKSLSHIDQACTVDGFMAMSWLAAIQLDCVLNRASNALDLLTKRFQLNAEAEASQWRASEGEMRKQLGAEGPPGADADAEGARGATNAAVKKLCYSGLKGPRLSRLSEAASARAPTLCDFRSCPGHAAPGSTGQMYMETPDGRPLLIVPQPAGSGAAYGYKGGEVSFLNSSDEITHVDVLKINKGLWFASLVASAENFTETQALYFHGGHQDFRYSGFDPAILTPLARKEGFQSVNMCFGSESKNAIDAGNAREFFGTSGTSTLRPDASIRPYWRLSKRSRFTAVASKVVLDGDRVPMGTISLDVNMSLMAQQFLGNVNLTESSYAVIVDRYGRILALSGNIRRLFNGSLPKQLLDSAPRCARYMREEELGRCSWALVKPVTLADIAYRINLTSLIEPMFDNTANCTSKMHRATVVLPRGAEHSPYHERPGYWGPNHHLAAFCALSSVPGWGLFIGTEYPDVTDAAHIRVEVVDAKPHHQARDVWEVSWNDKNSELGLYTKVELHGAFARHYTDQFVEFKVSNMGRIAIPLKPRVLHKKGFLGDDSTHLEGFLLHPNKDHVVKLKLSFSSLDDFGTYTGTLLFEADRQRPQGSCFPEPVKVRVTVKASEAYSVKVMKKLALYGFLPLVVLVAAKISRQFIRKHYKNEAFQSKAIEDAISSVNKIAHPMVIMPAAAFKRLGRLISHEEAQERHEAIWLYTVDEVQDFSREHRVVFISHQWTGFSCPDPSNTQYEAMVMSLETLRTQKGWKEEDMYIWVDFTSIPQKHKGTQLLAINSLTVYASRVSAFVVVAPHVVHKDLNEVCDKATYQCRAWCRAEQLAHLLVRGTANMYLAEKGVLTPLTSIEGWLEQSSYVFHGDLTCCRRRHEGMAMCDKEFLVTPMLGLWAQLCLRVDDPSRAGEPGMQEAIAIHAAINGSLDEIFPRNFEFAKANGVKERPLFGALTDRLAVALRDQACEEEKL